MLVRALVHRATLPPHQPVILHHFWVVLQTSVQQAAQLKALHLLRSPVHVLHVLIHPP